MSPKKISEPQIAKCPLTVIREAIGWARYELACDAYTNESTVGNTERGLYAKIPQCIMSSLEAYLPALGSSPEKLQSDYAAWRTSLGADVRRRADKYCELLQRQPGIVIDPSDEALIDQFLK